MTFDKLLDAIALGNREPEVLESLAGRLVRLEKRFDEALEKEVRTTAKGQTLCEIAQTMLASTNPDNVETKAKEGKDNEAIQWALLCEFDSKEQDTIRRDSATVLDYLKQ